jgi:DedD protein
MAFFKFRKGGEEPSGTPAQPESIDAMRKRAKYRLIGAAVLVLIGVIGFPILFDKQPRPISVDIPIEIPDRNKAKPLNIPEPVATPAVQATASAPASAPVLLAVPVAPVPAAPKPEEKVLPAAAPLASAASKAVAKVEPKPVEKAPAAAAPVKVDDGSQAKALLEGKDVAKKVDPRAGRFVVQVGAFSDAARAHEVRLKLEHAGLKTYTQVAETKDGRKTRVRVGPFASKAEADKAAAKIKKLGLPAGMLSL